MDESFLLVMVAAMAVVALATVWLMKRLIQPSTAAGKKRLTVFLRFVVAQYVIITALVVLSVEHTRCLVLTHATAPTSPARATSVLH